MKVPHVLRGCCSLLLVLLGMIDVGHAQGQCDSLDFILLCEEQEYIREVVSDCGIGCFSSGEDSCFFQCFTELVPTMSAGCVNCFEEQTDCIADNCLFPCAFGTADACSTCVVESCGQAYVVCAGIMDFDEDGESNVCDCDDTNPAMYSGAPPTGEGVDNDCDGVLSQEEAGCTLDLNDDGLITVADMLLLLSEFGCLGACQHDLNDDGIVTVADILVLLGAFGTDC